MMKVKVSYTSTIDEIPKIVDGILSECRKKMLDGSQKLYFNPVNYQIMAQNLTSTIQDLQLIEAKIEDALNITSGWLQAINQPNNEQLPEEPTSED
tara:strand:+ start:288 stop:575 length:288 start_codon:yes stop_codon:yes gene_type:complete